MLYPSNDHKHITHGNFLLHLLQMKGEFRGYPFWCTLDRIGKHSTNCAFQIHVNMHTRPLTCLYQSS